MQFGPLTLTDAGSFQVQATNAYGSTLSAQRTLTVNPSAPQITIQPQDQTVAAGAGVTLTVGAVGTAPLSYQWYKGGTSIVGATSTSYTISSPQGTDAGTYYVIVGNSLGSSQSSNAALVVNVPPSITTQPQSQSVNVGQTVTFTAAGSGSPSYQWTFNGAAISGATSATLTLANVQLSAIGTYAVVLTNAGGSKTSNSASLNVIATTALTFTLNPSSQTIASGRSVVFNALATGTSPPIYRWTVNGGNIAGATDPILIVPGATSANAGTYVCQATNFAGVLSSSSATLTVTTTSTPGYLVNLSARADVGTGNNILIGGFGVTGSGTKQLLIRGVGPGLFNTFGLTGQLVTPQLVLLDNSGAIVATNIGWANAPVAGPSTASESPVAAGAPIMANVGAFAYNAGSADTAMVLTMPAGNNTAQVSGVNSTSGIALCEIYDADATPTAHLGNISARADVGIGNNILIGGFTIGGSTAETVLIRAVGPGLTDVFGLTGTLTQPVLTLFQGSTVIYSNTVWGGDATIASVFPTVGAFNLVSGHQDSVLLISLAPGNYTAQVSGLNGGTGIALCEIYEVP